MKVNELFDDPYEGWSQHMKEYFSYRDEENKIYEGLIFTHNILASIVMIKSEWPKLLVRWNKPTHKYDGNNFYIKILFDEIPTTDIEKIFVKINAFGWFVSEVEFLNNKKIIAHEKIDNYKDIILKLAKLEEVNNIELHLEAKFNILINREDAAFPDFFYNACPKVYEEKIKKYGLFPKSHSKLTKHPERIYLTGEKELLRNQLGSRAYIKINSYKMDYFNN